MNDVRTRRHVDAWPGEAFPVVSPDAMWGFRFRSIAVGKA